MKTFAHNLLAVLAALLIIKGAIADDLPTIGLGITIGFYIVFFGESK